MAVTYSTQNALLYRGYELHVEEPSWIADSAANVTRRITDISDDLGLARQIARNVVSKSDLVFGWHMDTRDEIDRFMDYLYRRRGVYEPVWVPSWKHDLWLVADAASTDSDITIKYCGYTSRLYANENRRHLILIDPAGAYVIRRVMRAFDNGDGTETVTLEAPLGFAFNVRQTEICFLLLMRQASDTIETTWPNRDFCIVAIPYTELPEEIGANSGQFVGTVVEGFCGPGPDLTAQGWALAGDDFGFFWIVNQLSCVVNYGGSQYSAPSTSVATWAGTATQTFTGFTPNASVLVKIDYSLFIVVADSVTFTIASGSDAFTETWIGGNGNYPTYAHGQYETVADASGNVTVTMYVTGTRDVSPAVPPEGTLLEYNMYLKNYRMYEL